MAKQSFMVSDFDTGLETDKDPFLITEKAFPKLEDAYVFRGRVERRFGFSLFDKDNVLTSRLRLEIGTAKFGALNVIVPGAIPIPSMGQQQFSIGDVILTNNSTAIGLHALLSTDALYTGTFDNTTGNVILAFPLSLDPIYYYPGLPVMGLRTRELATTNVESTIAFDEQFAYERDGVGWDVFGPLPPSLPNPAVAGAAVWSGTNSDFFWTCNYRAAAAYDQNFYVVNGIRRTVAAGGTILDGIKYYTLGGATNWTDLRPLLNGVGLPTRYLEGAKIIMPFKDRLLVFNTLELEGVGNREYRQRCRFSQNGDPTAAAIAWQDDVVGLGGYIDAPTSEAITTVQNIKDRVIVFFERSTWELVYTGNPALPFTFQMINTELGCESTFSEVPFDDGVLGIGNRGIHVANTTGVERIDLKIPDAVGQINNSNFGPKRVYGIRDYGKELIMWTIPNWVTNPTFPNRVLVFNYRNNTFATFKDRWTCYGYHQKGSGLTWATLPADHWSEWTDPWNFGTGQARYPLVIAGNSQGFTHLFQGTHGNDPSLFITDIPAASPAIITCPDHNFEVGQYVKFSEMLDVEFTPFDPDTYRVTATTARTFTIDADSTGVYFGEGTVEPLNGIDIRTKNFDLFMKEEKRTMLYHLDVLMGKTEDGEVEANLYQDFNTSVPLPSVWGNNNISTKPDPEDTYANTQDKIWHRHASNLIADTFQIQVTLNDTQMRDDEIQASNITLHGFLFTVEPTGRIR